MESAVPSKPCTKCKVSKSITEFSPRANRNSLQSQCKQCCAIAARKSWRAKAADPAFRVLRSNKLRWAYRIARKKHKCGDCGGHAKDGKVYCDECREKRRLNEQARRAEDRKYKKCFSCGAPNPELRRTLCRVCSLTPERQRERSRRYERRVRLAAYDAYGGAVCACCGETTEIFLTIDHVEGNGNTHRRAIGRNGNPAAVKMYAWLKKNKYPPGFQVLCYNCNCGRHRNGGICPHKQLT